MTVPVTAGSNVTISWAQWPHNMGPIITYLGACNGDCATTDPATIDFFKIHEADFEPGTKTWVQSQTVYLGLPFTFTLPEDVPNGDFIMRHEIIALHNAMNVGGAEFFPQCIQVTVECGSGTIPDVYTNAENLNYVDPGPAIALQEDTGDDNDTEPSSLSTTDTTSTPLSASSSATTTTPVPSSTSTTMSITAPASASTGVTIATTYKHKTRTKATSTSLSTTSTTAVIDDSVPTTAVSTTVVSIELQNGRDAISLNQQFSTRLAGSSCTNYDIGCIGDAFGQCVWGTWVATKCPANLICAALPNINESGTSIACTTTNDRDTRIALTGAATKRKVKK
ncbi:hypothetical protein FRB97_004197, partial [Tulasnella sp. 331]